MLLLIYWVSGISVGFFGPRVLEQIYIWLETRKILKENGPREVDQSKLCKKGTHNWVKAHIYKGESLVEEQVCDICGYMPSANKMFSEKAVDNMQQVTAHVEAYKQIKEDFLAQEIDDIKKTFSEEIKNGVSLNKLCNLRDAGVTCNQRFMVYKIARVDELEKVYNSDA